MAPIAKEPDTTNSAQSNAGATTPSGAKPQPAAAEIPVTVNGARTVEGSDKREPFSESTRTVLVFANGAVIRLSSAVASGQLLFLTNEKTKKEVVCQVVKSKNYSNVSGYVELEFTEAAPGFWGLRFPTNGQATSAPNAMKPIASAPAPSGKSLEEKIAETKAKTPAAPPMEPKESPKGEVKVASLIPVQSPSTASKIPTLSEFLTQGGSGPALKAPEREKPDSTQQKRDSDIQDLKQQAAKLQDQLSSKAFTEPVKESEKRDSLTNLLVPSSVKENPAPGTSTFDFGADEVKIPAWLEPLARNSAPNFATHESKVPVPIELDAKSLDPKAGEANASEALPCEFAKREPGEVASSVEISADDPPKHNAVFTLSGEGPTPNFGSSLALDAISASPEHSSKGSGQGLILGVAAAALLFAAGGGWYWYSNQPKDVSANAISTPQNNFGSPAVSATVPAAAIPENSKPGSGSLVPNSDANRSSATPQTIRTENREAGSFASGISKPAASATAATKTNVEERSFSPAAEPVKKPSFGKVVLAAPTANRRVSPSDNNPADTAPSLGSTGDVAGDSSGLNVLASKGSQPAAPLPIGGNCPSGTVHFTSAVSASTAFSTPHGGGVQGEPSGPRSIRRAMP